MVPHSLAVSLIPPFSRNLWKPTTKFKRQRVTILSCILSSTWPCKTSLSWEKTTLMPLHTLSLFPSLPILWEAQSAFKSSEAKILIRSWSMPKTTCCMSTTYLSGKNIRFCWSGNVAKSRVHLDRTSLSYPELTKAIVIFSPATIMVYRGPLREIVFSQVMRLSTGFLTFKETLMADLVVLGQFILNSPWLSSSRQEQLFTIVTVPLPAMQEAASLLFFTSPRHIQDITLSFQSLLGVRRILSSFLVGHQDENSTDEFLDILSSESPWIEEKLGHLFIATHPSTILDLEPLELKGERLSAWRDTVVDAPTPLKYKYDRNLIFSGAEFSSIEKYTAALAAIMMYDKCGLLQMVLYQDGREEIRKTARKIVGERKIKPLIELLMPWVPQLFSNLFTENDLIDPKTLRIMCDAVAAVANNLEMPEIEAECVGPQKIYKSLTRLMMDLGEAMVRCEGVETISPSVCSCFWQRKRSIPI